MKKLLFLLMLLCPMIASAQDVIVKKDGSTVVCRVEKVSETDITYKLWSDLKGSSFVMDKSLVSAINYESGKKETFSETTSLYTPNNQNNGVQALNDNALLNLDKSLDYRNSPEYKKIKRLKTWGWIGGGFLTIAGIAPITVYSSGEGSVGLIAVGVGSIVAGAGVTTLCLVKAHREKKNLGALGTSSLYRYDIPFSNGSQLSVGADMLHDRIMDKRTVGLGLSYNF